jgi:hypothetical protein
LFSSEFARSRSVDEKAWAQIELVTRLNLFIKYQGYLTYLSREESSRFVAAFFKGEITRFPIARVGAGCVASLERWRVHPPQVAEQVQNGIA